MYNRSKNNNMNKKCKTCSETKPLTEYNTGKSYCKPCQYEYTKAHNKKNYKKYYEKYTKGAVKKAWQRGQDFFNRHKGFCGCKNCGEKRYWVLDYHHIDPNTKERPITYYKNLSMSKLKEQIRNCVVLCSNCHRDLHHSLENQK
tara:strand:+ start:45 stop:476 length:432 start_codon:yes stop_codon:yes gene_type:complete